jgi:hypothetical protein
MAWPWLPISFGQTLKKTAKNFFSSRLFSERISASSCIFNFETNHLTTFKNFWHSPLESVKTQTKSTGDQGRTDRQNCAAPPVNVERGVQT